MLKTNDQENETLFKNIRSPFAAFTIVSCDEEFEGEVVKDNQPEIPVVFEGATTEGFNPYYTVSYANGNFSITVSIPEDSPLKIKEVTNVVAELRQST